MANDMRDAVVAEALGRVVNGAPRQAAQAQQFWDAVREIGRPHVPPPKPSLLRDITGGLIQGIMGGGGAAVEQGLKLANRIYEDRLGGRQKKIEYDMQEKQLEDELAARKGARSLDKKNREAWIDVKRGFYDKGVANLMDKDVFGKLVDAGLAGARHLGRRVGLISRKSRTSRTSRKSRDKHKSRDEHKERKRRKKHRNMYARMIHDRKKELMRAKMRREALGVRRKKKGTVEARLLERLLRGKAKDAKEGVKAVTDSTKLLRNAVTMLALNGGL